MRSGSKADLKATLNKEEAYRNADVVVIATPTDFDNQRNQLDTQKVDLSQIRWVVLMILFNTPGNESSYTWLQNLNSDKALPYIH